jgi:hypothetical protein
MEDTVIVGAVRTRGGSFGGQFKDVPATLGVGGGQAQAAIIRNRA